MKSSSAPPSDFNDQTPTPSAGDGAAKFLADLPSRGFFSSTVLSSNPGRMRVHVCDHDTAPPAKQHIKTNQTNRLIRSLMLKKQKGDSSLKDRKANTATECPRKRTADRALDSRAKRAITSSKVASRHEGSKSLLPAKALQSLTVERIHGLLKEKGLSLKGRKDVLIARLKGANE